MREEFLNIWIHEDKQLEVLLNEKIISREKLHHWPLSYVEKVTMKNNSHFVYKTQHSAASVEKDFYAKIKSPFLTSPIYSETYENCDIMILPYLEYPTLEEVPEIDLEQIILKISHIVQNFSDMPVFFDLSSVEKLTEIIETVSIVFQGKDENNHIAVLKNWIYENAHTCYDGQQIGNVHSDLAYANILTENGELRYLLDWQRPMKAPLLLENALAFRLAGYDAVKRYGNFGILATICFFLWYSYACHRFLPFVFGIADQYLLEFVSHVSA